MKKILLAIVASLPFFLTGCITPETKNENEKTLTERAKSIEPGIYEMNGQMFGIGNDGSFVYAKNGGFYAYDGLSSVSYMFFWQKEEDSKWENMYRVINVARNHEDYKALRPSAVILEPIGLLQAANERVLALGGEAWKIIDEKTYDFEHLQETFGNIVLKHEFKPVSESVRCYEQYGGTWPFEEIPQDWNTKKWISQYTGRGTLNHVSIERNPFWPQSCSYRYPCDFDRVEELQIIYRDVPETDAKIYAKWFQDNFPYITVYSEDGFALFKADNSDPENTHDLQLPKGEKWWEPETEMMYMGETLSVNIHVTQKSNN